MSAEMEKPRIHAVKGASARKISEPVPPPTTSSTTGMSGTTAIDPE